MKMTRFISQSIAAAAVLALAIPAARSADLVPQPGDVYREYAHHGRDNNRDWRVTDPNAKREDARKFLPNPVMSFEIGDLKGATRAEAVVDRWGGHPRTADKRIRFNGADWIALPELSTTPADHPPQKYLSQDNPSAAVPLEDLKEGANSLEGTCGVIENFGWGQWGLYSVILRVYYAPEAKPHATGRIVSPQPGQTIGDNPVIEIATEGGATRVDVVAHCLDLDYDGDGVFEEWVEAWHQAPRRGDPASIRHHVGTAEAGENGVFRIVWDTQWLPDQAPGGVSLVARIANADGTVFVSPIVDGLSLDRPERSVKLYVSNDVPEDFGVRVKGERSCAIDLPEAAELANAKAARLYVRTWNGSDELHLPLRFNAFEFPIGGVSHHYGESLTDIPTDHLQSGPNTFTIRSEFKLHDLELLWPGPMLLVEYAK